MARTFSATEDGGQNSVCILCFQLAGSLKGWTGLTEHSLYGTPHLVTSVHQAIELWRGRRIGGAELPGRACSVDQDGASFCMQHHGLRQPCCSRCHMHVPSGLSGSEETDEAKAKPSRGGE